MEAILFGRRGSVVPITINRSEAMNALDFAANDALIEAWKQVRDDWQMRAAVLTGVGDLSAEGHRGPCRGDACLRREARSGVKGR